MKANRQNHMARTRILGLLLLLWGALPLQAADPPATDLRVLIDVSGSMKQNDPNNLRVPAMRMLVGLMPEGIRSGVWSFGRYVNMDVKLGIVDEAWKQRADEAARRIHSRGLYTNIEEALRRATRDWRGPAPEGVERHLILLTDGMVDVSKDPAEDAHSRQRVLEELLPAIHAAGGRIHTIALSSNADAELLQTLSNRTDGWYEQVEDAETLQRIFLRLFESSVKPDSVPLEGNSFAIDESISDMTVLAFHPPEQEITRLRTPEGALWSADEHPESVKWLHQQHYDMITVNSPSPGEWLIEGELDPDNRVMVVTNLRLETSPLPANLLIGDALPVTAWLLQGEEVVTDPRFLALSRFYLRQESEGGDPVIWPLADDGEEADRQKGDGIFSTLLNRTLLPGSYEIAINAYGPTYKRELRRAIKIHDVPFELTLERDEGGGNVRVELTTTPGLLKESSIRVRMTAGEGTEFPLPLVGRGHWSATLPLAFAGREILLDLHALRNDGSPYDVQLSRPVPGAPPATAAIVPGSDRHGDTAPAESPPSTKEGSNTGEEPGGLSSTMKIGISIGVGNLILGIAGFFGWRAWNRQKVADALVGESLEELSPAHDEEEASPPQEPPESGGEAAGESDSRTAEEVAVEEEARGEESVAVDDREETDETGEIDPSATESMIEEELDLAADDTPAPPDGDEPPETQLPREEPSPLESGDTAAPIEAAPTGETGGEEIPVTLAEAAPAGGESDPPAGNGEASEEEDEAPDDDLAAQWEAMLEGDATTDEADEPEPTSSGPAQEDDDLAAQWEAMLGEEAGDSTGTGTEEVTASSLEGNNELAAQWEAMLNGEEGEENDTVSLPESGDGGKDGLPPEKGAATGTADPTA